MQKIRLSLIFGLVIYYCMPTFANYYCRWTAEGTNSRFERDNAGGIFNKPPLVVTQSGCETKLCTGMAYCKNGEFAAPIVAYMSCSAVNGKCPSATACGDDPSVVVEQTYPTQEEINAKLDKDFKFNQQRHVK